MLASAVAVQADMTACAAPCHDPGRCRGAAAMPARELGLRAICLTAVVMLAMLAGCARDPEAAPRRQHDGTDAHGKRGGIVTVSGDDSIAPSLTWRAPAITVAADAAAATRKRADAALAAGDLYADAQAAIPLYMALLSQAPDDIHAQAGLRRALAALIAQGDAALAQSGDNIEALRRAHQIAAVARAVDPAEAAVHAYLQRVDGADTLWELNRDAERDLAEGRYGERGGGALDGFRQALQLQPDQPRAAQGLAALESAMIRRAEDAGAAGDFVAARQWLGYAAGLRPRLRTVADARARIERMRAERIDRLRDAGIAALPQRDGIASARRMLAELLRIAEPGDPAAAELRERIDLAQHYGLFRPGQAFTDALHNGARGPQMVVVPHGVFQMGATEHDAVASDRERPRRAIAFERGFALSATEVSVGQYRRFVNATAYRTRAQRRGYSMTYDARSGNFTRRSGVDWRMDYAGTPAADDLPVLHVSAKDAEAYARWLGEQSGHRYRLPSEAEFEYALRTGQDHGYPWGEGAPPADSGNFTGAGDRSPGGRSWVNAFAGYADGYWGPAPVGHYRANAWGLHDLAGNISEWVADCWHDSYRRAPKNGDAWLNPGCRTRVVRGGSWASSPAQTRSAWRAPASVDSSNGRVGFRVVREI